jgi:hypothetical protein
MDTPEEHTPRSLRARWQSLSGKRRIMLSLILIVGLIILVTLARSLFSTFGTDVGYYGAEQYVSPLSGGSMSENSRVSSSYSDSSRGSVAYEMDSVSTSYTPETSVPQGDMEYETRAHTAHIRTTNFNRACATIERFSAITGTHFAEMTKNEQHCSYSFKTVRANESMILDAIRTLDPDLLTTNIETIKRQVVRYQGEMDILLQRERALEETFNSATEAYETLVTLAKDTENATALSMALRDKLMHMQNISRERTNLAREMQALSRAMSEAQDRVEFVQFQVNIEKYEVVNYDNITDSWYRAMQSFAYDVNKTLQDLTLGIVFHLLLFAQFLLYGIFFLIIAKHGLRWVKRYWKNSEM